MSGIFALAAGLGGELKGEPEMPEPLKITLVLGSVRRGRQSPKVARFLEGRLAALGGFEVDVVDLAELALPVMEERLRFLENPPANLVDFSNRIAAADAVLIVTPEYNNGIPGALKNALDYLFPEWQRKPVGIATVSAGAFGGINCLAQLRLVMLLMGALPIPATFAVPKVQDAFNQEGDPLDPSMVKRADAFLADLRFYAEALRAARNASVSS